MLPVPGRFILALWLLVALGMPARAFESRAKLAWCCMKKMPMRR